MKSSIKVTDRIGAILNRSENGGGTETNPEKGMARQEYQGKANRLTEHERLHTNTIAGFKTHRNN